jgi:HlyD family secretion protein
MTLKKFFTKKRTIITVIGIIIVIGIAYAVFHTKKPNYVALTVARGDIVQEVTVTGNTKPSANVDLAFERSGTIRRVYVDVGTTVSVGQVLAELDSSELQAQLDQARAGVLTEQAKLDELKRGSRPEDIRISQSSLDTANQDLIADYASVVNIVNDAYSKADDGVRKQIADVYLNSEGQSPQLAFTTGDTQAMLDAETQRLQASQELNTWNADLKNLSSASSPAALELALQSAAAHLTIIQKFLNRTMDAVVGAGNIISPTSQTGYKAEVTAARLAVSTALTNVITQSQAINAQKTVVTGAQNELDLKKAGSTAEDIAAQTAQVAQAQANVENFTAQLAKTVLRSPLDGVVTRQDAKAGQLASPGTVLVSIITASKLKIEANVPEVDIGKLALGNPVIITLDAFPGETFTGTVTHIDPGETIIDGVVNYKIDVTFDRADQKLKSGLTANLRIQTQTKHGVLILPQFAILETDQGTFVRRLENGATTDVPVQLGIRNQNDQVEVLSGVTEGETVLNIGVKTN